MYAAILSNDIYLSASGCSEGMWAHAFEEAKLLKQLKYPTVSFKCTEKGKKKGKNIRGENSAATPTSVSKRCKILHECPT